MADGRVTGQVYCRARPTRLRSDNRSGWCQRHGSAQRKREARLLAA